METRAHFIIVGLFTLFGIVGGLGFFLWLASVQIDRQYSQYGVLFANVSGLDMSADVLFNGVEVGRVTAIRIWERDPSRAFVGIEIDAETPVAIDTIAELQSQGVTGVAYIALSGGAPGAPRLTPDPEGVPIIPSRQSSFQTLVSDAPALVTNTAEIIAQLQTLTGPDNQEYVRSILQNVDAATAGLEGALTDFSEISQTLRSVTDDITGLAEEFTGLGGTTRETLSSANDAFAAMTTTFETADKALADVGPAIRQTEQTMASLDTLLTEDVPEIGARLKETLARADQALDTADKVFASADGLIGADLGPAIADARTAIADVAVTLRAVSEDTPLLVAELRAGVAEARAAITAAAPGLRDLGLAGGEARAAIRALTGLIRNLGQNPSGFLLDNRVPEYRR